MADAPFHFVFGDDDYLVAERGKAWFAERTVDLQDDLSKEVIDGRAGNVAEVETAIQRFIGAVQTLSLFGEQKVVWLRDVNFLADSQTGRAQGTLDLLESLKETLESIDPDGVAILITALQVDKRRSFFKWCQKHGSCEPIDVSGDQSERLKELVRGEAAKFGVSFSSDALHLLVGRVNGNTRLIVEEVKKLATFAGEDGALIDEPLVNDLVPNFGEGDFFEAADAFFSLKLEWTLDALRRHFFTNSDARGLLSSLQSRNRLLIQLRVLMDAGALKLQRNGVSKGQLESAAATYGEHFADVTEKSNLNVFTQNPWYLGRLAVTASAVPLKRLVDFQIAFSEAFEGILQRPNEQEDVCRELAVRCLS